MRWTKVCHLKFANDPPGVARDSSLFTNDAISHGGIKQQQGSVNFFDTDAEVVIQIRNDSLQRFCGLQLMASIRPLLVPRRQNIIEGWMSFAFFVQSDGVLVGGIYDGQNWVAVKSAPGAIPFNQWSRVVFTFDGISRAKLCLDGQEIGQSTSMPLGMHQPHENITVGHWPSGDNRYTFAGEIGEIVIFRHDWQDHYSGARDAMLCNRRLNERQAGALAELKARLANLPEAQRAALRDRAKQEFRHTCALVRDLRAADARTPWRLAQASDRLLDTWCCGIEPRAFRLLVKETLFTTLNAGQRALLKSFVDQSPPLSESGTRPSPLVELEALFRATIPEYGDTMQQLSELARELE